MNDTKDISMLIEAFVARSSDPLTRFIQSLPNDQPMRLRSFAEETVRLRHELAEHTSRALTETDTQKALAHAEWIHRNIHDVVYRWTSLVRSVQQWAMLDVGSLQVRIDGSFSGSKVVE